MYYQYINISIILHQISNVSRMLITTPWKNLTELTSYIEALWHIYSHSSIRLQKHNNVFIYNAPINNPRWPNTWDDANPSDNRQN